MPRVKFTLLRRVTCDLGFASFLSHSYPGRVSASRNLSGFVSKFQIGFAELFIISVYSALTLQAGATITNFIDNYSQLNMFRAIISSILSSTRLCLQLVV